MASSESSDLVSELKEFYNELVGFINLANKGLRIGRLTEGENKEASSLHASVERKVGYLGDLIAELSGIEQVNVGGKEYELWRIALSFPINKRGASAFGDCIQATNRAIGKLEGDIRTGKRDAQTGELLVKSGISSSEKANWEAIKKEYGDSKRTFGKKIKFISGNFNRQIIFRDIEHAFQLANSGFSKSAVILAGGVIEELLRLYLEHKNITPINNSFDGYIQTCDQKDLLKAGISRLSDSARHFRNLVHLSKEESKRHTISKSTAKGAVASIFTIANDF